MSATKAVKETKTESLPKTYSGASKSLVLKPRVSEKTYAQSQSLNVYTFEVPTNTNKLLVADAVAAQFNVTVLTVNMLNQKGKSKRTIRRGGRAIAGQRKDTKKAYVTLKAGDAIPIFAAEDETKDDKKTARRTRVRKGDQ